MDGYVKTITNITSTCTKTYIILDGVIYKPVRMSISNRTTVYYMQEDSHFVRIRREDNRIMRSTVGCAWEYLRTYSEAPDGTFIFY